MTQNCCIYNYCGLFTFIFICETLLIYSVTFCEYEDILLLKTVQKVVLLQHINISINISSFMDQSILPLSAYHYQDLKTHDFYLILVECTYCRMISDDKISTE